MLVDSFKYLPRLIASFYKLSDQQPDYPIPWTPLPQPITECKIGLITSGGLYHKEMDKPFDLEREKEDPAWGDPTYRVINAGIPQHQLAVSHLHINPEPALTDINVLLPIHRLQELAAAGRIGGLAEKHYSFMGYQGYPPHTTAWQEQYAPEVAAKFKTAGVNCVLLVPA